MSDYDTAATIEDGRNESLLAGGMTKSNSGLPQHVINELRRKAPQALQKKEKFDVGAWLNQIQMQVEAMGPEKLHTPYLKEQLADLREGDQPGGFYSFTTVAAVIAAAKTLPYATEAALELAADNGLDVEAVQSRVLELLD